MPKSKAPRIDSFVANPNSITIGQSVTLSWNVSGQVAALTIDHQVGSVLGLSSKVVTPIASGAFILTASNRWGSAKKSVSVQVVVAPPVPPPEPPPTPEPPPIPEPPPAPTQTRKLAIVLQLTPQVDQRRVNAEQMLRQMKSWYSINSYGICNLVWDFYVMDLGITDDMGMDDMVYTYTALPLFLATHPEAYSCDGFVFEANITLALECTAWIGHDILDNPAVWTKTFCHETAHSFRLQDEFALRCGNKAIDNVGILDRAGFSIDGSNHMAAPFKEFFGWIPESRTITISETIELSGIESPIGTRAVRFLHPRPTFLGMPENEFKDYIYVHFRQHNPEAQYGADDYFGVYFHFVGLAYYTPPSNFPKGGIPYLTYFPALLFPRPDLRTVPWPPSWVLLPGESVRFDLANGGNGVTVKFEESDVSTSVISLIF